MVSYIKGGIQAKGMNIRPNRDENGEWARLIVCMVSYITFRGIKFIRRIFEGSKVSE